MWEGEEIEDVFEGAGFEDGCDAFVLPGEL